MPVLNGFFLESLVNLFLHLFKRVGITRNPSVLGSFYLLTYINLRYSFMSSGSIYFVYTCTVKLCNMMAEHTLLKIFAGFA